MRRFVRAVFDKRHGPIVYALKTAVFTWTGSICVYALLEWLSGSAAEPPHINSPSVMAVTALIGAPLFENFLLVILSEFVLLFKLRRPTVAAMAFVGLLAGAVHATQGVALGVSAALVFAMMTYTYFWWTEYSGPKRYLVTVLQHFLLNLPATAMALGSATS